MIWENKQRKNTTSTRSWK